MSATEYVKIQTYLRGRFRHLGDPESHAFAPCGVLPSGLSHKEFMASSPLPEAVNKFLIQLDAKIDALLAGMVSSSLEEDFQHLMEIVSLGASGIDFITTMPLAHGDFLEVIMHFSQGGTFTASGIGAVTERRVEQDGKVVFSLSFTRILEEEREKIIHFVFKEERRQLRETRIEQE